jgi:hypothetical protein
MAGGLWPQATFEANAMRRLTATVTLLLATGCEDQVVALGGDGSVGPNGAYRTDITPGTVA